MYKSTDDNAVDFNFALLPWEKYIKETRENIFAETDQSEIRKQEILEILYLPSFQLNSKVSFS